MTRTLLLLVIRIFVAEEGTARFGRIAKRCARVWQWGYTRWECISAMHSAFTYSTYPHLAYYRMYRVVVPVWVGLSAEWGVCVCACAQVVCRRIGRSVHNRYDAVYCLYYVSYITLLLFRPSPYSLLSRVSVLYGQCHLLREDSMYPVGR